ncbi:MAG TPA: hypothetical protein PLC58_14520 [Denitromonas sp.]|nr:hypothetical protein [Denitromonas sp.]
MVELKSEKMFHYLLLAAVADRSDPEVEHFAGAALFDCNATFD